MYQNIADSAESGKRAQLIDISNNHVENEYVGKNNLNNYNL